MLKRFTQWIWTKGVVSTFMAGLFVILPIVITVAIMSWFAGVLVSWLGPESYVGRGLIALGQQVGIGAANEAVATLFGWGTVLAAIWLIGVIAKSVARRRAEDALHGAINRLPVIKSIYKPVVQVVNLLKNDENADVKGMSVVYCTFGPDEGAGFLALLTSNKIFQFKQRESHAVYIPTSPVPMSGGIVFIPVENVTKVDMAVDDLMKIYFSLGVLAGEVVPKDYVAA